MSSNSFIFLDTRHAVDPTEPSVGIWNLNMRLSEFSKTHIQLEDCSFVNGVYPINANNNTLVYEENAGGSTTTSTLTPQNYTGTQFATEIQTQMNADTQESTVYTVSYNSQTKKLTITTDGNDFQILSTSTCLDEIGIARTGMSSAVTSKVADYVVRLDGTQYVDIVSSLSVKNVNTSGRSNILARVYITVPFGSVQVYENQSTDRMPFFSDELTTLELRLVDDKGNLWELPQNTMANYSLKMDFS